MSIEQSIDNLAAAISKLADVLTPDTITGSPQPAGKEGTKKPKPAATQPAEKTSSAAPAKTETPSASPSDEAITYEKVKVPFLELVQAKGRDAALAAIAPLKDLKSIVDDSDRWAPTLAKINAALKA